MRNYNEQEWAIVYDAYVNQRRGLAYCASLVNSTINEIKHNLNLHDIHIRTQREAAIASNQNRATYKDVDYFKRQSPNMAWLLGFIASDGTIRKDANEIKIGLARRDKEILEKIKEELKLATNIRDYTTTNGYDCSTLQWTCAEHKEDLAKYNIIPAKTFQLKPPDKLDPKYYIDYIRGYFDGDGSVNFIKSSNPNHSGALRWQICAAKPEMLEWIMEVLYKQYDIPKVTLRRRKDDGLCYIQYSTNSTKKIHEILYTPNSLCLARKKNHFDEIVNDKISPRDCISSSVEDKQVC